MSLWTVQEIKAWCINHFCDKLGQTLALTKVPEQIFSSDSLEGGTFLMSMNGFREGSGTVYADSLLSWLVNVMSAIQPVH